MNPKHQHFIPKKINIALNADFAHSTLIEPNHSTRNTIFNIQSHQFLISIKARIKPTCNCIRF